MKFLEAARSKLGYSQPGFAKKCGLSKSLLTQVNNGSKQITRETAHKIFFAFGFDLWEIKHNEELPDGVESSRLIMNDGSPISTESVELWQTKYQDVDLKFVIKSVSRATRKAVKEWREMGRNEFLTKLYFLSEALGTLDIHDHKNFYRMGQPNTELRFHRNWSELKSELSRWENPPIATSEDELPAPVTLSREEEAISMLITHPKFAKLAYKVSNPSLVSIRVTLQNLNPPFLLHFNEGIGIMPLKKYEEWKITLQGADPAVKKPVEFVCSCRE